MRHSQTLDEPLRLAPYKRMGDACLFLTGMFREYLNGQWRTANSRFARHALFEL